MGIPGNTVEVSLGSSFEYLDLLQALTDSITSMMGFDTDTSYWIGMSVRESVINAMSHGNKLDISKKVDIRYEISDGQLAIQVDDQGNGFDPQSIADPLDPQNLLKPSGRGIFYMRSFMDEVLMCKRPEGGMQLRMMKRLAQK
jgi:serine/threonine-protein kinase RsbW